MKLTRIALAALVGAITLTGVATAPAAARTSVSIEYRDRDYRGDYRDRDYRRDNRRDYRDRRYWDRRHDDRGYGRPYYRDDRYRCWTEWRTTGRHERYQVRICR